jgi:hypothetical protein
VDEKLTPEQQRAKLTAGLPKPLKPIPPEIMAEILADQIPYEEAERQYKDLVEKGGLPLGPFLEEFDRMLNEKSECG